MGAAWVDRLMRAMLEAYSSKIELSILTGLLPLLYDQKTQMGGCFLVSAYLECSIGR
jgi:hypothetical protein